MCTRRLRKRKTGEGNPWLDTAYVCSTYVCTIVR